ncbi:uncharacterized protein LOC125026973 [Penaeus chinensis]|uniref:uncharacterized protein LOC125026973 n=1 Tax=Penaeus chinensis TaxID=139456 RepID=UPI001FB7D18F|nr:uncharacterized protein LOC125026973 [Penaeus chinensis]
MGQLPKNTWSTMSGRSIHPLSNELDHKGCRDFVRSFEALEKRGASPDAYADLAKDFFDSWTAHGFNNCYKARSWCRRVTWLTLCLSLLTLCLILCYQVVQGYLLQPKTVHIKVVHETITEYPAITVCNLNPFPLKDSVPKGSVWEHLVELEADFDQARSCDGLGFSTHLGASGVADYFADDYGDYERYYDDGYNESTFDGGSKRRRRSTLSFSDFEDLLDDLDPRPFDLMEAPKERRKARSTATEQGTGGSSSQGGAEGGADSGTDGGTDGGAEGEGEDDEDPGMSGPGSARSLSKEEVMAVRISCSKYYRLLKKISEIRSDTESIGTEDVPECKMKNFHEQVRWSHICQVEVIDDNFGSYTYYLRVSGRARDSSELDLGTSGRGPAIALGAATPSTTGVKSRAVFESPGRRILSVLGLVSGPLRVL